MSTTPTQVFQIFIRTTPEGIWDATTRPEFTVSYFHGSRITITITITPRVGCRADSVRSWLLASAAEPPEHATVYFGDYRRLNGLAYAVSDGSEVLRERFDYDGSERQWR
jgi:hypothetical protein